jgi:hypothetical protein
MAIEVHGTSAPEVETQVPLSAAALSNQRSEVRGQTSANLTALVERRMVSDSLMS